MSRESGTHVAGGKEEDFISSQLPKDQLGAAPAEIVSVGTSEACKVEAAMGSVELMREMFLGQRT